MTLIGAFGSELSCSSHCDTLCPCPSAARAVAHKTMQTTPSVCLLFVLLLAPRPPMRLFDYTVSPHSSKRPPLPYSPGGARFKGMDKLRKPLRAVTIMQAATRRPQSAAMIRQLRSRQDGATPSAMRTKEAPAAMASGETQPATKYDQGGEDEVSDLRRRRQPSANELRVTLH